MLGNLLANAVKHTPPGTNVRVTAEPDGAGHVVVAVADSGRGIAPEHRARIFEKFCQLDASGAAGGAGIGLAFCKMAAEAHRGKIWVESTQGQGATFRFTLPQAGPKWATELNAQTGVRP